MTEELMAAKRKALFTKTQLTIGEAAFVLGTDRKTLSHWIGRELIGESAGVHRNGRKVRFDTRKLRKWMRNGKVFKVSEADCEIGKIIKRVA